MARSIVRYFAIPESARGDIQAFLEKLSRSITARTASIVIAGDKLRVELYGSDTEIFMSLERIRKILSSYRMEESRERSRRVRVVSADDLRDLAGAKIPIDTLAEYLRRRGYYVGFRSRRSIETNAPREVVEEAARKLAESYERVSGEHARISKAVAKALSVILALTGRDLEKVVELCLAEGLASREESGKLVALRPWTVIVGEALRRLRAEDSTIS
ncbi:MAG: DUF2067 family protein [Acidilobaceae archaeon]